MVVQLNPVEFAKAMMKKKKQLVPTPIVLDNGVAGIVYGYYECNGIETRNSIKD